jgi:HPt (histidine-containing phosphotransfer) domain-containing protein
MDDKPVVDPAALERLQGLGGDKLLGQMVQLYLENAAERLRQIDDGLAGGELSKAEGGAHSLKSSAANVGAARVNAIAAEMEQAAMRGDEEVVRRLRPGLGTALSDAESQLRELTGGLGS